MTITINLTEKDIRNFIFDGLKQKGYDLERNAISIDYVIQVDSEAIPTSVAGVRAVIEILDTKSLPFGTDIKKPTVNDTYPEFMFSAELGR